MKDFFDIWLLSSSFEFDGPGLAAAVQATFARRQTSLEVEPVGFSNEFAHDPSKAAQWKAFICRSRLSDAPDEFTLVVQRVREFLQPIARAVAAKEVFAAHWPAGSVTARPATSPGPWGRATQRPKSIPKNPARRAGIPLDVLGETWLLCDVRMNITPSRGAP